MITLELVLRTISGLFRDRANRRYRNRELLQTLDQSTLQDKVRLRRIDGGQYEIMPAGSDEPLFVVASRRRYHRPEPYGGLPRAGNGG